MYKDIFTQLCIVTLECDEAQETIDVARSAFPHDGYLQLQLDRKQEELDSKRSIIENLISTLAARN